MELCVVQSCEEGSHLRCISDPALFSVIVLPVRETIPEPRYNVIPPFTRRTQDSGVSWLLIIVDSVLSQREDECLAIYAVPRVTMIGALDGVEAAEKEAS